MQALRNNRGITVIYLTLFLWIAGGLLVALSMDVGYMIFMRRQARAEVDAAVLRAASALPLYNITGDTTRLRKMARGMNSEFVY